MLSSITATVLCIVLSNLNHELSFLSEIERNAMKASVDQEEELTRSVRSTRQVRRYSQVHET